MDENAQQNQATPRAPLRRPVKTIIQKPAEKKERIKTWMAVCMIIVALCVDGAQALLTVLVVGIVMGPIISAIAYFTFWVWFMVLGVSFTKSPKKLGVMGGSAVLEFLFSFLPGFTAGITAVVFMTKAEDKGGLLGKVASVAQGKTKL
ncbi:MAG: hypothetical protein V1896_02935 [Candidatus Zambryskibacteria bacterium]